MSSPTIAALSRRPKYISDSEGISDNQKSRLDYLASPELVDILTKFMLGGRLPSQVEEGTIHPMDPTADRTAYISEQPPPRDLLGSAMERGNPLAWMEQVQEPEGTPPPSLVETLARKGPQIAEQVAIMAGAAKGVGGARGTPRMQWEPKFGAEKPKPASESRKPRSDKPINPNEIRPDITDRAGNVIRPVESDIKSLDFVKTPAEPSPELVSALAEFNNLTPEQFDKVVNSVEVVEPSATNLPINASAESGSGGSVEAINRAARMGRTRYVIVDRAGNVRPSTEDTPRLSPNEAWGEMDAAGNFTPLEGNMSIKAPKK
jgi:hypothetical protein